MKFLRVNYKQGAFCVLFLLASIFAVNKAQAISSGGISAFPSNPDPNNLASKSWFIYNLDPGEEKEDSVTIRNDSDKQQVLKIYAVDAITNNMGGFALSKESDERKEVGSWIELEEQEITLEAKEYKKIDFKISIPYDASVGEHAGGIVIQKGLTEEQKNAKGGFLITTRVGVRVYQTVPGEIIKQADFGDVKIEYNKTTKKYVLSVGVQNKGNVTLSPKVEVEIKDKFFKKQGLKLDKIIQVPRDSETQTLFEFEKPKGGKFEAEIKLTYEGKDEIQVEVVYPNNFSFWVVPWGELIVVLLIALANLIFFGVNWLLKRKDKKFYKKYTVHEGEDLEEIASILGVTWQKLAKINKIKPPYKLYEGQEILVIDKDDLIEYEEEMEEDIDEEVNGEEEEEKEVAKKTPVKKAPAKKKVSETKKKAPAKKTPAKKKSTTKKKTTVKKTPAKKKATKTTKKK